MKYSDLHSNMSLSHVENQARPWESLTKNKAGQILGVSSENWHRNLDMIQANLGCKMWLDEICTVMRM